MSENNFNNPYSQPQGFENNHTSNEETERRGTSFHANGDGTWGQTTGSQSTGYSQTTGQTGYGQTGSQTNSQTNSQTYGQASGQNNSQTYGQASSQQATGYGSYNNYNQSSAGAGQGANPYSQYYQTSQPKQKKPKKEKNPNRFSLKLAKCAAIALVFGLVAGSVFTGVQYTASKALGVDTVAKNTSSTASISIANTSTATSATTELTDVSALVSEAMKSCVAITNTYTYTSQSYFGFGQSQSREATSCGSGVILSKDDNYLYIATNNHVVEGAEALTVQFCDDTTVSAEVKGTDASTDLAVIKVALSDIDKDTLSTIKTATVGDAENLLVGNACIAIGNALGYGQSVTTGVVSALNRSITVSDETSGGTNTYSGLIQTDAAINPGNSGGALLNAKGEVIGINSAKYSDTSVEGVGYAISMTDALPILEQLITQEKVDEAKAGYLGIQGYDVSESVSNSYGLPLGVYVYQTLAGSGAEKAGLEQGDIITALGDTQITSMEQLQEALSYHAAGDTVTITVAKRSANYESTQIEVTLTSKN